MLSFEPVPDNEPLLLSSPLIRGVLKIADYISESGGIGLTQSGAFNRKFVSWAAANFDWPGYSEQELYRVNKVLDEIDFPPIGDMHALLAALKLGRRWKGMFRPTGAGRELVEHPGRLLSELVPNYLFRFDHRVHFRFEGQLLGNWDIFLNLINVEADNGCDLEHLRTTLYGPPEVERRLFDRISSNLYVAVVRPLCWSGLLRSDESTGTGSKARFYKTELWRRYLRLDTDNHLSSPSSH